VENKRGNLPLKFQKLTAQKTNDLRPFHFVPPSAAEKIHGLRTGHCDGTTHLSIIKVLLNCD
jgi:hypothetical protein